MNEITRLSTDCPLCKKPVRRRHGRNGEFMGCSNYPRCDFTEPLDLNLQRIARQLNAAKGDVEYFKAWAAAVRECAFHTAEKVCPECTAHLSDLEALL